MKSTTIIRSAALQFREGSSDKVYHVAIESRPDGYIVAFAYGRRGATLTVGTKTETPVSLVIATTHYDKLIASKLAKGYKIESEESSSFVFTGQAGTDSGVRCQLLNPVDGSHLGGLLADTRHWLQQKHDGRRLLVRKKGGEVIGINRRGLIVALPEPIRVAVVNLPLDALIDGEAVDDVLHAFDLLELKDHDLRDRPYLKRYAGLLTLLDLDHPNLQTVATAFHPAEKVAMFAALKRDGREGVVFKDSQALFSAGRPASAGPALKFKFVESASFIVTAINTRRSVTLGLFDGSDLVGAGNVTVPPNHPVPAKGRVVEVRYLYALRGSGSIYQPVYRGERDDIPSTDCVVDQLKYKSDGLAA